MLSVTKYTQDYIDSCRSRVARQLSTYKTLVNAARAQTGTDKQRLADARDAFEATFFNTMILVLDNMFVHRSRTLEKKDGNPLNEVRLLCNSLLQNNDVVVADKSIKMDPAKSILGLRVGDGIRLTEAEFHRLSEAFFSEIEAKYL